MFPIICLSCQIEAVNNYIKRFQLNKESICMWLAYYGELVRPHEESKLRGHPLYIPVEELEYLSKSMSEYAQLFRLYYRFNYRPDTDSVPQSSSFHGQHIFRTAYGFLNVFQFAESNQLKIQIPLIGFPWNRNISKKYVQE